MWVWRSDDSSRVSGDVDSFFPSMFDLEVGSIGRKTLVVSTCRLYAFWSARRSPVERGVSIPGVLLKYHNALETVEYYIYRYIHYFRICTTMVSGHIATVYDTRVAAAQQHANATTVRGRGVDKSDARPTPPTGQGSGCPPRDVGSRRRPSITLGG